MFDTVLIANRGEIACRVIRTCQRLGIEAVAVYSSADAKAKHVGMADRAIEIGGAPASQSYLTGESIIKAAKKAKAQAIHPGYGFLSENPSFVEAVEKEGLTFIGPSSMVIAQMGDKIMARRLAREAGVPISPGAEGEIDDAQAVAIARGIGFPLMIKAADGGGGMGIRVVNSIEEVPEAVTRARSQALNAFGSSRVYMERRIQNASHVEVQVIADHHGKALHLFERDCSVQRRNQKVVEETPCAKLTPEIRSALLESAVRLVKSIGYTNAGTIEYLYDAREEKFYFLEMNTRLQVEHPVTEMATGLDLVELQLRVAAGERLPLSQSDVHQHGAAIEARIYPEDPVMLLPTAGTVSVLVEPEGPNVRVDSALYQGYEVSPHYESMMAKLIVHGETREEAIAHMLAALDQYVIEGPVVNIPLVRRVMEHKDFRNGAFDNAFLERMLNEPARNSALAAAIAVAMALEQESPQEIQFSRWRMHGRRMAMANRLSSGVLQ